MQDGISGKGKLAEAFPGWEAAPSQELSSVEERAFAREIIGRYRADCGERGRAVSGGSAREFVEPEIVRRRP